MASASASPPSVPALVPASTASSFILAEPSTASLPPQAPPAADDDDETASEVDSLPSISTSVLSPSDAGSDTLSDAQREWEASLEQLQLMLTMMVVPFAGKFLGRKFAYWSWTRYMTWAYSADVRFTSKAAFDVAGAVQAAATL